MKNKLGKSENLEECHSNGEMSYMYYINSSGYSYERTYDENGNRLTYKNSEGDSWERTYDERSNELTNKNSEGYSYEYTYD